MSIIKEFKSVLKEIRKEKFTKPKSRRFYYYDFLKTKEHNYCYEIEYALVKLIANEPIRFKDKIKQQEKFNVLVKKLKINNYSTGFYYDYLKKLLKSHNIEYNQITRQKIYRLLLGSDCLRRHTNNIFINLNNKTVRTGQNKFFDVI